MENYVIYDTNTNIIKFIETRNLDIPSLENGYSFIKIDGDLLSIDQYWIDNGELKIRPPQPSNLYIWNGTDWIIDETLQYNNQAEIIRSQRDELLLQSDWTDTSSAPTRLGADVYNSWQVYRQQLRDIPEQNGFPLNVAWPTKPS